MHRARFQLVGAILRAQQRDHQVLEDHDHEHRAEQRPASPGSCRRRRASPRARPRRSGRAASARTVRAPGPISRRFSTTQLSSAISAKLSAFVIMNTANTTKRERDALRAAGWTGRARCRSAPAPAGRRRAGTPRTRRGCSATPTARSRRPTRDEASPRASAIATAGAGPEQAHRQHQRDERRRQVLPADRERPAAARRATSANSRPTSSSGCHSSACDSHAAAPSAPTSSRRLGRAEDADGQLGVRSLSSFVWSCRT